MKNSVKLLSIFLLAILLVSNATAEGVREEHPGLVDSPALQVKKVINVVDRIEPGYQVNVTVNITNFGGSPAYNLTIEEPSFENYTVKNLIGYDEHKWIRVDENATFSYAYSFIFEKTGNYLLESTRVTYFDENGTEYTAFSGTFDIDVTFEEPPIEKNQEWRNILIMSLTILIVPLIIYNFNKHILKR